jgi:hypothetical protein
MTLDKRPLSEMLPVAPSSPGRARWNRQRVARGAWIVLALVLLANFVVNIPAYYESSRAGCTLPNPADCPTGQLTLGNFQALGQLHISVEAAAYVLATLTIAVSLLYWVIGLLIFQRKGGEWTGLFFSLVLVMLGATGIVGFTGAAPAPQLVQLLTNSTYFVLNIAAGAFLFSFPTGRFASRWTWAAFALYLLISLPFLSFASSLIFPLVVGVQIYRYVRVYDTVQRQQAKWFVFACGVGFSFIAIYQVLGGVVPGLSAPDSWYQLLNSLTWLLFWTLLILSLGISILRYRLWDIDLLISRTLLYGSLTVLLVALYGSLVVILQALVRALTGSFSQQPLVIVGSTLAIAALIQPLKRRLQAFIDRRFYRRKYDATRTLAAFSATARDEVDLNQLTARLLDVVEETMQPAQVSLWLRRTQHEP